MKYSLITLIALLSFSSFASDDNQIRETIQTYVNGYLNAEKDLVGRAFYHETRLYSLDEQKIDRTEMRDWFVNLDNRKATGDIRTAKLTVKFVDITGMTAIAKIELKFKTVQYTDYLSFLKYQGSWVIVGKVYSSK